MTWQKQKDMYGMFDQVDKRNQLGNCSISSNLKMEQQLVRYLKLLHTTMPILLLPRKQRIIMIYE